VNQNKMVVVTCVDATMGAIALSLYFSPANFSVRFSRVKLSQVNSILSPPLLFSSFLSLALSVSGRTDSTVLSQLCNSRSHNPPGFSTMSSICKDGDLNSDGTYHVSDCSFALSPSLSPSFYPQLLTLRRLPS